MFAEPRKAEDEVLLAQLGYSKLRALGVALVVQHQVYDLADGPSFIWGAIDVEHQDWLRELPSGDPVSGDVVSVDKLRGGSAVNESIDRKPEGAVCGLNLKGEEE